MHTGITLIRRSPQVKSLVESKCYDLSPQIHPHTRYSMWTDYFCPMPLIVRARSKARAPDMGSVDPPKLHLPKECAAASFVAPHRLWMLESPENMVNLAELSVEG